MRPVAGSVQGTSGDNRGSTHGGAHKRSRAGHALATPLGTKSGRPTAPPHARTDAMRRYATAVVSWLLRRITAYRDQILR
jgi:hypothetical protein